MNSHPPPRYTSRGGYHELSYDDSTIFPMPQDSTSQQQHEHDHYHYQQEQQYMLDKLSQEAQLQQKIAEGMLTPRANNHTTAMDDDEVLFGMDDVPITFMNPKPWEESTNSYYHDDGQYGGTSQFPAMGPFPTNDVMNMNNIDMATEPPAAVATAVATTTSHHPTNNNNGPSSTKSVTFKTHDEFHSWDEQLDQLLHVDEEFFNVAHYLLEVVNVGSVLNFDSNDEDENVGHYFDNDGGQTAATAVALTPVNDGIDCNSGGILARFFTFAQCGAVNDVDYNEHGRQDGPSHHRNNNNNSPGGGGEKKKYKLTKKLVQDFEQALKFRMENIDSNESLLVGDGMENEIVTRTKQIADKVEAYGLPGMPPPHERMPGQQPYEEQYGSEHVAANNGSAAYEDCYEVDCDEVEEEFMRTLQASKMERRKQPRHFPILPTDDDEDVKGRGGMNEDERRFYNTFGNISTTFKESTQKQQRNCNSQSPFKSVCKLFSTLVGPKTSTPSKEECQIRLQQIQREISNADRMMESSTSKEVIAACANRIKKLRDEERMYQIFKEISKIQAMMQATESGSVKNACGQRLYQLSAELNSIDLGQYDDELDVNDEDDIEVDITVPVAKAPVAKAIGGDDLDWYERAQRYVRTQEPQDPVRSSYQHTTAANGHYRPPHMQQYPQQYPHQYSQQYPPHPSYIPDDENYYDRHYPAKQQFASPSPPRRVLSPRNGRPFPHPPY
eukprot:scaffold4982_cov92-Skeletonema_dohrnii-CCMP3373.AAC.7